MSDTRRSVAFNGVDGLMRGLDGPRRPQTIELEVALAHHLDERRLAAAVATTMAVHPMARARQGAARPFDLNYTWVIDDEVRADPVEFRRADDMAEVDTLRDRFSSAHIDLETGPPFRLLVVHEQDVDRVMLSVSHVAFDGVGTLRLLQSISRAYAGEQDAVPDVDPLEARALLDRSPSRHERRASTPKLAPAPARLAASHSHDELGFGILHLDLDVADAAPPSGSTVNDVLMAALHLAVEEWNGAHNASCGHVSVMMPVNQRPEAWRGEVLANLVLSAQVVSRRPERAQPGRLLEVVSAQTAAIKAGGSIVTAALARTAPAPVFLRRLVPHVVDVVAERTADTAVLSNLGRVADPPWFGGDGTGLWFGPPPRSPVILTVGAATTGGRLGISLRWCRSALSAAATRELADMFRTSLRSVRRTATA